MRIKFVLLAHSVIKIRYGFSEPRAWSRVILEFPQRASAIVLQMWGSIEPPVQKDLLWSWLCANIAAVAEFLHFPRAVWAPAAGGWPFYRARSRPWKPANFRSSRIFIREIWEIQDAGPLFLPPYLLHNGHVVSLPNIHHFHSHFVCLPGVNSLYALISSSLRFCLVRKRLPLVLKSTDLPTFYYRLNICQSCYTMAWNYQAAKQKRSGVLRRLREGSGTFESGMEAGCHGRALNVTRGAVARWLSAYRDIRGLPLYRYRKITKSMSAFARTKDELRKLLALGAEHFGYPGAIWTLSRVRDLILRNSGYRIAYVQCCCHHEKNWLDLPETSSARHSSDEEASKNGFRKNGRK